ncbi:MAG: hypothetical protein DMG93_16260 [Acidobacteria bacterium]|jgi:hypothetical protein|nr:MAG: hypothetical protein DMG93_16260 [Acidobacteriota bacterium]
MIRTFFLIYGVAILAGVSLAEYRGWSLNRVDEVLNVPKSVRDNPGSYRSVYGYYHHYTGGK